MKTKDITVVALRLYALLLFFDCIQDSYRLLFQWYYPVRQGDVLGKIVFIEGIILIVFYIVVGALLLRSSEKIALWIIPTNADEGMTQIDSSSLLRMSLGLAGAIFFVNGIRLLVYTSALWYFLPTDSMSRYRPDMPLEDKAKTVEALVLIISGLILFMGRKGLAGVIRGIQTFGVAGTGTDNEEESTEHEKRTSDQENR
jgi:hypothetical protein